MGNAPTTTDASGSGVKPRPAVLRALGVDGPPKELKIADRPYTLLQLVKHDSWACTALYEDGSGQRVVVKHNRRQPIGPIPMLWLGHRLARRENGFLERMADHAGVPTPLSPIATLAGEPLINAAAHVFVPGRTLLDTPDREIPDAFFASYRALLDELHRRDIAYVDLNKQDNVVIKPDGQACLLDFQISFSLPARWPGNSRPMRRLLETLQEGDRYHLMKHWIRRRPDQLRQEERDLSMHRPRTIRLYRRWLGDPMRRSRRRLLVRMGVRSGAGRADSEATRVRQPIDREQEERVDRGR